MSEQHRSYYAIITANVRYDEDLTANAKLLYGEITALCNERGYCWATNAYFADLYKVSKSTVSRWIQQLIEKGYIESEMRYKEGSKEVESRILTIATPIRKNEYTPMQKNGEGTHKNEYTPPLKNAKDNNTSFNNTSNNDDVDVVQFFQNNIRFNLNPMEVETIQYWENDYSNELIIEAIKRTALNHGTTVRYTEAILKRWTKDRLSTVAEVELHEASKQKKGGRGNATNTKGDERPSEQAASRRSL